MQEVNNRVRLYPDGKYRWIYEVPMLKNPSIIIDVLKVMGISLGVVWLLTVLLCIYDGNFSLESVLKLSMVFVGLILLFAVIVLLAYVILAWKYGWKYIVLFTMDQTEIIHQQMPQQVEKAQVLGALAAMIGGAAGSIGMVGTGVLAASRSTSISTFVDVRKLVSVRRMNLIKVNQTLNKNRIYVPDEDFDFVYDFLRQQCINAKE